MEQDVSLPALELSDSFIFSEDFIFWWFERHCLGSVGSVSRDNRLTRVVGSRRLETAVTTPLITKELIESFLGTST